MGIDLGEARARVSRGDQRGAIDGLKTAFFDDPRSVERRVALSTLYRELGYPDQAGRWGYIVPGFCTDAERRAFEASLRGQHASASRLRDQMKVDRWTSLPVELARIVSEIDTANRRSALSRRAEGWSAGFAVLGALGLAFGWLVSVYAAELPAVTVGILACAFLAFAIGSALGAVAAFGEWRGTGWAWIALTAGLTVVAALSYGAAIFAASRS